MLLAMAKKKETLTLNKEDLDILNEVLADYKGFIEYTYKNNLMIIAQGEQMLKTSSDKAKTIELCKGIDQYKEQAKMLDIARLRADGVHLKVKEALGIKDEPDEVIEPSGDGEGKDDTPADEPNAEVSESVEVLPKEG
jgi:hypothetical protein